MNATDRQGRTIGFAALAGFLLCIPGANWLIGNVGTACVPDGPCLVPVLPGIMAPSGVLLAGAALVLRDVVQRQVGARWAIAAILAGGLLTTLVAPHQLALASTVAFLVSEAADMAVYTPLQRRGLVLAVMASACVGSVVDSVAFLDIAFHDLGFLAGQVAGKAWAVALSLPLIGWLRRAVPSTTGSEPA